MARLSKSLVVGDKSIAPEEFERNLAALTGASFLFAVREAMAANGGAPILVYALDAEVQLQVAAMAAGVDPDAMRKLPLADFAVALQVVSSFLLDAG